MIPRSRGYLLFSAFLCWVLLSEPALADVCKQVRPGWSPEDGPVSMIGEAMQRLFTGGGIFLMLATGLAIKVNKLAFSLVVSLGWFAIAALHQFVVYNPVGIDVAASEVGCIGSPVLAIGLFILVGFSLLAWQVVQTRKAKAA